MLAVADTSLVCAHGWLLPQDGCASCATAGKKPHKGDSVWVADETGRMVALCAECRKAPGDGIHWTAAGTPAEGPSRIGVEEIETGIALDLTAFVTDLVVTLAQGAAFSDLCDVAELYESAAAHDGHAREQLLVEELVGRLATRLPQRGIQALALADEIRRVAAPLVTEQRRGA